MTDLDALRLALGAHYAIEKELGRGGMATVYLARDLKHDRLVAVKVLHPEFAMALGAERFLREIRIAARLNHPHILPLHDSGQAGDFLYYVMPFVEGESLRDRLSREKQLPVDDAIRIARQVADALSYAHTHDVVHRDIKPENILLDANHAVVADFGIARAISAAGGDSLTQTGIAVGTPAYMSPEQGAGSTDLDGRSDLYALACVLYEMLAGQPPFTGPTAESIVRQHLMADPPIVTRIRPAVPADVVAALTRAMAKSPADRYNQVALFAEALGRRESGPQRERHAAAGGVARRRRWVALASAAVVALIVVGAALIVRGRRPAATSGASSVIAVLPLQNLTTDTAHAYFAGGLHDEILTQLSRISSLRVISRTSVLGYADRKTPLKQIASDLGAGMIVEGTVQAVGTRLRVNVQLIDATTDAHLWAESYDRTMDDAFAIQSDIARKIVSAVGATLTSREARDIEAAPTANAEAYRYYLQGREYERRPGRLREDFEIAQRLFEQSLALDPDFALAHASLSRVHGAMYWWRYDPSEARATLQLREAEAAMRLAPDLPESHVAMGYSDYWGRRDYGAALRQFGVALRERPNDVALLVAIAGVHRRLGDWDEVVSIFRRVALADPRNVEMFNDIGGQTFLHMHRYDDALDAFDHALTLAPDFHVAAVGRGMGYLLRDGQLDTLRALLDRLPPDAPLATWGTSTMQRAQLHLLSREPDSLLRVLAGSNDRVFEGQRFFLPTSLYAGWAHQLRGDQRAARSAFDSALNLLDATLVRLPDEWRVHAARGLALSGLGRRAEALREAQFLATSTVYRDDAISGTTAREDRAWILAQAGDTRGALDEIRFLLTHPSLVSVRTLRLDPRWDPIRTNPAFTALLALPEAR